MENIEFPGKQKKQINNNIYVNVRLFNFKKNDFGTDPNSRFSKWKQIFIRRWSRMEANNSRSLSETFSLEFVAPCVRRTLSKAARETAGAGRDEIFWKKFPRTPSTRPNQPPPPRSFRNRGGHSRP